MLNNTYASRYKDLFSALNSTKQTALSNTDLEVDPYLELMDRNKNVVQSCEKLLWDMEGDSKVHDELLHKYILGLVNEVAKSWRAIANCPSRPKTVKYGHDYYKFAHYFEEKVVEFDKLTTPNRIPDSLLKCINALGNTFFIPNEEENRIWRIFRPSKYAPIREKILLGIENQRVSRINDDDTKDDDIKDDDIDKALQFIKTTTSWSLLSKPLRDPDYSDFPPCEYIIQNGLYKIMNKTWHQAYPMIVRMRERQKIAKKVATPTRVIQQLDRSQSLNVFSPVVTTNNYNMFFVPPQQARQLFFPSSYGIQQLSLARPRPPQVTQQVLLARCRPPQVTQQLSLAPLRSSQEIQQRLFAPSETQQLLLAPFRSSQGTQQPQVPKKRKRKELHLNLPQKKLRKKMGPVEERKFLSQNNNNQKGNSSSRFSR